MNSTSVSALEALGKKGRMFAMTLMALPFALFMLFVVCAIIQGPKVYPPDWEFDIPDWSMAKVTLDMLKAWCTEFWPLFGSIPPILAGIILYFQPKDKGSIFLGIMSLIPFGLFCFASILAISFGGRIYN